MDPITQLREQLRSLVAERQERANEVRTIREACAADNGRDPSADEATRATSAAERRDAIDAEIPAIEARIADLVDEQARDERAAKLARDLGVTGSQSRAVVTSEARTYTPQTDRTGKQFLLDVARGHAMGDYDARDRLARHMAEERVERGEYLQRAVGTGAFAGLTVPQYLVDMVAPNAKAGRPFADACNKHQLPEEGMTVNISKITTGSTAGIQALEGDAVAEQNMDDTLLSISVQTNAGQQSISRQAIERGHGVDDVVMSDLVRAYATKLDSTLITQATTGLSAAAGATVAYTDASPTATELYPKLLDAASQVEAALLSFGQADLAVMHSRRWYWLQSQLSASWPVFSQPNIPNGQGGVNLGERYGAGFRGVLPNGLAVVTDNNIATNLGAGVNEDEIYVASSDECHLWEDPNAPLFIRAEEVKLANLQVLFVLYGYFAYTFTRFSGATAKIGGTGLVTPTF